MKWFLVLSISFVFKRGETSQKCVKPDDSLLDKNDVDYDKYKWYYEDYFKRCIGMFSEPADFETQTRLCAEEDGVLEVPYDYYENQMLEFYFHGQVAQQTDPPEMMWLGARWNQSLGMYIPNNGLHNWVYRNLPSHSLLKNHVDPRDLNETQTVEEGPSGDEGDCLAIHHPHQKWARVKCDLKLPTLCFGPRNATPPETTSLTGSTISHSETSTTSGCPTASTGQPCDCQRGPQKCLRSELCGKGWCMMKGSCYTMRSLTLTQQQAKEKCSKWNAQLVMPVNRADVKMLQYFGPVDDNRVCGRSSRYEPTSGAWTGLLYKDGKFLNGYTGQEITELSMTSELPNDGRVRPISLNTQINCKDQQSYELWGGPEKLADYFICQRAPVKP